MFCICCSVFCIYYCLDILYYVIVLCLWDYLCHESVIKSYTVYVMRTIPKNNSVGTRHDKFVIKKKKKDDDDDGHVIPVVFVPEVSPLATDQRRAPCSGWK